MPGRRGTEQTQNGEDIERQSLSGGNIFVKNATKEVRMGFVRKVYGILTAQLLLTVAVAAPIQRMPLEWISQHVYLMYISMAVTIATICAMSCCQSITRKFPTNYIFLFVFTLFEGVMVGFISAFYTGGSVVMCAGITALIFFGLTAYAWTTKTDFTGFGPYLFGALLSLCVFGFVMCIMRSCGMPLPPWVMMGYDILGILIFVMYIVFDTQLIIGEMGGHKNQFGIDDYVFASLNLYLDIINLFIHLLSLLGDRK